MTSEAHHLDSPPPAVSVKARAKEIEARSGASGKGIPSGSPPPVTPRDGSLKRYQVPSTSGLQQALSLTSRLQQESAGGQITTSYPSRRSSEGDILHHHKTRILPPTPPPKQRRVSLENAPLPAVPERRATLSRLLENGEGSCTSASCQTETTSKFAPFTGGGKSGVTCGKQATSDFSPSIFRTPRLLTESSNQSALDDIIYELESLRDGITLSEIVTERLTDRFSAADQQPASSERSDNDDVFEKGNQRSQTSNSQRKRLGGHDVSDKSQWLGVSRVAECQELRTDSTARPFESKQSSQTGNYTFVQGEKAGESESIIYRSAVQFTPESHEKYVVSATLQVSPPKTTSKPDSEWTPIASPCAKYKSAENFEQVVVFDKCHPKVSGVDRKLNSAPNNSKKVIFETKNEGNSLFTTSKRTLVNNGTSSTISRILNSESYQFDYSEGSSDVEGSSGSKNLCLNSKTEKKVKKPSVAIKPKIPEVLSLRLFDNKIYNPENGTKCESEKCDNSLSDELEKARNILASFNFEKYKRRVSLDDMEGKSPKPPRMQKTSSGKFKDLFDMLKPSSDNSSSANKRPFGLCRSSSFSNAEITTSDKGPPTFFLQNEENDAIAPLPDSNKRISTLPRRKSPSRQQLGKVPSPPVPAVSSCPSIMKIESLVHDPIEPDIAHDEGLVSDSEVGPGAYVTAYVSCVTSSSPSGRRGHVRSASDNVTSVSSTPLPKLLMKKTSSSEKLWTSVTSRLNGTEKRKRRKGIGCKQSGGSEPSELSKSGTSRSLTYPPQRKSSTSEEEQEFSSVDSNGLKSLKLLTAGLADSGPDVVRLLSDLSLADSHLCPSEGMVEETYLDVADSVIQSPADAQHLSVGEPSSSCGKPHKKKHHSDPGGEASSSGSVDVYMADAIGSSRSEPDLGGNEIITPSSSSCSSASSETSSKATQTLHHDQDDRQRLLKLVIEGQPQKKDQSNKHVRAGSGGSLTSGATPNSRFHFPDTDPNGQRLAIDYSSKSPQEQRRYSKRRLRGPYGEMLEEEMRKSGEKQKPAYSDLSFLQDLGDLKNNNSEASSCPENVSIQSQNKPTMFLSSQSLDDASSTSSRNELSMCVTPKRKVSANYPLLTDGENVAIASDEDISPTKPTEPVSTSDANANGNIVADKNSCQPKPKSDFKGLLDFTKFQERSSDTRTHVVGELYDTEKSYVESLQILANLLISDMKQIRISSVDVPSKLKICLSSFLANIWLLIRHPNGDNV